MTAKSLLFEDKAREKLLKGISTLSRAVSVTLGPKGRNVVLEKPFGGPRITKDGVTVAKEIELSDRFENLGAQMIREVATRASEEAGDGTTTATILADTILREGVKALTAGSNPINLKAGIDAAVKTVVKGLKETSTEVSDFHQIAQVGTISANGEKEIGEVIARAMEKVGREGVITVEENKGLETELDIVEGMQFDRGYSSPYFITNSEKMLVELDAPLVLIYDKKLSTLAPLLPLLEKFVKQCSDRSLLIIAEDIEGEALTTLVVNKLRGGMKVCAVKAPGFGDRRKENIQDIAVLLGTEVASEESGIKLENVTPSQLGSCRFAKLTKDSTTLIDGKGEKVEIEKRSQQIRNRLADKSISDYDRDKLRERLGKLSGGVAVIKVGGMTELEVKERKDRVDDALNSTKAAVAEGIVAGGGIALLRSIKLLDGVRAEDAGEFNNGVDIIRRALEAPTRRIAMNAGFDGSVVINRLTEEYKDKKDHGFDALNGQYCNMVKEGILDPTKVVRTALEDAASVAGLLLTTEAMVVENKEEAKAEKAPAMPGGMPGMGGMM